VGKIWSVERSFTIKIFR